MMCKINPDTFKLIQTSILIKIIITNIPNAHHDSHFTLNNSHWNCFLASFPLKGVFGIAVALLWLWFEKSYFIKNDFS
jgi:hypothetical protein